jgi:hypothetical protein
MNKFFHTIRVWLYKNLLTENPNDYTGRTRTEHVYNVEDISHLAEIRGSSGIPAAEMARYVHLWLKEMAYQLCDANGINTGYFTASLHVKGVFESPVDPFDSRKHKILFQFHQGSLLRKELDATNIEIAGVAETNPIIDTVTDLTTGDQNLDLTIGGIFEIKGFNLKYIPDDAENGIFFITTGGGLIKSYRMTIVPTNTPHHLLAQIPASITAGDYMLEVRTTWSKNPEPLKSLKIGQFPGILSLQPPKQPVSQDETPAS